VPGWVGSVGSAFAVETLLDAVEFSVGDQEGVVLGLDLHWRGDEIHHDVVVELHRLEEAVLPRWSQAEQVDEERGSGVSIGDDDDEVV